VNTAAITHRGSIRTHNEDAYTLNQQPSHTTPEGTLATATLNAGHIIAIADGMGGHGNGATASHYALERLRELTPTLTNENDVRNAINQINTDLYNLMLEQPHLRGMGTTLAGILFREEEAILFNVGDSKIYLARPPWLQQLSHDDSATTDANAYDPTQTSSNVITQAIGGHSSYTPINPHVITRPLRVGDRYLLCSDGLTDALTLDAIEKDLSEPIDTWVESLLTEALAQTARDNVTIVVAEGLQSAE
jgi:serine/threonine protein phosphatase PrpC